MQGALLPRASASSAPGGTKPDAQMMASGLLTFVSYLCCFLNRSEPAPCPHCAEGSAGGWCPFPETDRHAET